MGMIILDCRFEALKKKNKLGKKGPSKMVILRLHLWLSLKRKFHLDEFTLRFNSYEKIFFNFIPDTLVQ